MYFLTLNLAFFVLPFLFTAFHRAIRSRRLSPRPLINCLRGRRRRAWCALRTFWGLRLTSLTAARCAWFLFQHALFHDHINEIPLSTTPPRPFPVPSAQAADAWSTAFIAQALVKLCGDLKQWRVLNEQIQLLAKRRAQLKKTQQVAVQEAMTFIDAAPDQATKLELIETLRQVSAGKIFVEIERARLTMMLARMKEAEGNISAASDTLQEIQVRLHGSSRSRAVCARERKCNI